MAVAASTAETTAVTVPAAATTAKATKTLIIIPFLLFYHFMFKTLNPYFLYILHLKFFSFAET